MRGGVSPPATWSLRGGCLQWLLYGPRGLRCGHPPTTALPSPNESSCEGTWWTCRWLTWGLVGVQREPLTRAGDNGVAPGAAGPHLPCQGRQSREPSFCVCSEAPRVIWEPLREAFLWLLLLKGYLFRSLGGT